MVEAIIFDLNGVFLKSEYLTTRLEHEFQIPTDESLPVLQECMKAVRQKDAPDLFDFWKNLFTAHNVNLTRDEFLDFWFSGESLVKELLDYSLLLRSKGIKIFILSNNFRERTTYYREHFPEIFSAVDQAYFSWETRFIKPDPEAFLNVIRENNLDPVNVLYFDDSEKNIEVAKSLGLNAYIFENLKQIRQLLEHSD